MSVLKQISISKEMKTSFLDYAMSVIVARALPDVRDGLKPVHRRIVYSMNELGMYSDKPFKKSARIVGEVIGKYHPHGDAAIYGTMVRMAQDFSYRYMLIDGHGNFGSIDGDGAAAMRYTEARMSKISMELVKDIKKNTIDFKDNYDGSEREPVVLPARFPNLLVNGTTGIAVGMATNIPPHNLTEVVDGVLAYIENPEITIIELMEFIKGPDFPTGALILGRSGIKSAYETGRGSVVMRGKCDIIDLGRAGKQAIIITEIPYQVNKARLVEKIADLVRDKRIDGITDLRDESNMKGIRIVIELRRDANANVILNNLYKQTALQSTFGVNNLSLVNGEPKVLCLKDTIKYYVKHQREVIIRRTQYELDKALAREHLLEGLTKALDIIDQIINLIRSTKDGTEKQKLIEKFEFSEEQAQAILDMRLKRLSGLEREKLDAELAELRIVVAELKAILADEVLIMNIIKDELIEIKDRFGDERRSIIDDTAIDFIDDESLIPQEDIVITLTKEGYIKSLPSDTYKTQNRGGRGITGMKTNEEDYVDYLLSSTTHSYILFFTNKGKVYRTKGYNVPKFTRTAKGLPLVNLLPLEKEEHVTSIINVEDFKTDNYLLFSTKFGSVKRTHISEFESIRQTGKICITLKDNDELIAIRMTNGSDEIVVGASNGKLIRFHENDVRPMGRTASGVRGLMISTEERVVGMEIVHEEEQVLVVSEKGYGKRTPIGEYRLQQRGGKGVKTISITEKNGKLVSLRSVKGDEDLMIITNSGIIIRMPVEQISVIGRATQGVRLIKLGNDQYVATVAKIVADIEEEE